MKYRRIATGKKSYNLYPIDKNVFEIIDLSANKDYYESIYHYEQHHYDAYMEAKRTTGKGSLAGIKDVKTNKLIFDFDDKENIENARNDATEIYARLIQAGLNQDDIQVYFSGDKGFHLQVKLDQYITRPEFENIIFGLASDLPSLDRKVKDEQRLIRIPFTKHATTGLRKTPITIEQLSNDPMEVIREQSSYEKDIPDDRWVLFETWCNHKIPITETLKGLKVEETAPDKYIENTEMSLNVSDIGDISFREKPDFARKLKWLSSSKYALQEGFFVAGERNEAFMILAATYRANGIAKEVAYHMLKGSAELQAKRTDDEKYPKKKLWNEVINTVYSPTWRGGTYSEKQTDLLQVTAHRFNINQETNDAEVIDKNKRLWDIGESIGRFEKYASDFSNKRVKIGIEEIDNDVIMMTGMMVGLLGAAGSGKTSIANKIVKSASMAGEKVLYECLDMTEPFLITRLVQNYAPLQFEDIMKQIEEQNYSLKLVESLNRIRTDYANVYLNYRSATTLKDIENDILEYKEKMGEYPRMVIVDYLEKIKSKFEDLNARSAFTATGLADLAREYDVLMLVLLQPQKSAGDINDELVSMRKIKGSSVIEQDCRVVLTAWRPGAKTDDIDEDQFMSMAVVKNTMGKMPRYDFHWNGLRGDIRSLTDTEKYVLRDIRQRREEEQNNTSNTGWYN